MKYTNPDALKPPLNVTPPEKDATTLPFETVKCPGLNDATPVRLLVAIRLSKITSTPRNPSEVATVRIEPDPVRVKLPPKVTSALPPLFPCTPKEVSAFFNVTTPVAPTLKDTELNDATPVIPVLVAIRASIRLVPATELRTTTAASFPAPVIDISPVPPLTVDTPYLPRSSVVSTRFFH